MSEYIYTLVKKLEVIYALSSNPSNYNNFDNQIVLNGKIKGVSFVGFTEAYANDIDAFTAIEYEGYVYAPLIVRPIPSSISIDLEIFLVRSNTFYYYTRLNQIPQNIVTEITLSKVGLCVYDLYQVTDCSFPSYSGFHKYYINHYIGTCYTPEFIKSYFKDFIFTPDLSSLQKNDKVKIIDYIVDDLKKSTEELNDKISSIVTGVYVQSITDVYSQLPKTFDYKDFTYNNPLDVQDGDYLVSYIYIYEYKTAFILSKGKYYEICGFEDSIKGTIKYPYLHTKIRVKRKSTKCCLKSMCDKSYLLIKDT